MSSRLDFIQRANAAYIEEQYARYRRDPASVPEDWQLLFAGFELAGEGAQPPDGAPAAGGSYGLVTAYREFGHLIARLDPLGDNADSHPLLDLAAVGLTEADLDAPADPRPFHGEFSGSRRDLVAALRETYCSTLGIEYMDIADQERREWFQQRMEPTRNRPQLGTEERVHVLRGLLASDAFEQFLHVKYVGQKRFSLEGAATLVPMLDALIEETAGRGVEQLVIGMPHRGRINVLAHLLSKPLERIFSEFESSYVPEDIQGHGDVKYHLGYSNLHRTRRGPSIHLDLTFNPSHLEFVNPVVLGAVRARQQYMNDHGRARGVPVLIHGDAAFSGEGIVPEMLTLTQLPAYETGGTVHIIVNNQIGFTTSPADARVSRHATDLARVVDAPVLHVNGDDPEMAVHAMRLAIEYRMTFKRDVFVDLICYRKHGHNELDDPTFTQPVMYTKIAQHLPASRTYAQRLLDEGVLTPEALEVMEGEIAERLQSAHQKTRSQVVDHGPEPLGGAWSGFEWAGEDWSARTEVARETLERIARDAARLPDGFHAHPKVAKLMEDRIAMLASDRIDWGCGEMLAIGSLVLEGHHVRLSGQDSGRGTFSHRHAILRDARDGRRWVPLQHLAEAQGRFDIIDTMLSEAAVLGFEYGYSTADPHTLVLWEAQFGDFANVAQVYIDQFLASAESKWRRMSGLTLLLPHGYEGQGPEHSSARLERFLELCANGNMQVCNPTTPAQFFHVVRRQMHRRFRKPLVLMTPKSLLRHKAAVSPVRALTNGGFDPLLDDTRVRDPQAVHTVLLTSGKFFYTLDEARGTYGREDIAIVRLEQVYPFPRVEMEALLAAYPAARDVRWVQEEPANMGSWRSTRHRIEAVLPDGATLSLVARKAAPTPATGYYPMHVEQEKQLLERAFATSPRTMKPSRGPGSRSPRVPASVRPGGAR